MRLLVLTTSFPSTAYPGSGVFVRRLLAHMKSDAQITVLTPGHEKAFIPIDDPRIKVKAFRYAPRIWQTLAHRPGGIPVSLRRHPLLWLWMPLFFAAMFFSVLAEVRKVDLISAQWSLGGVIAGLAGLISGKPVVTTFRGEDVHRSLTSRPFRWALWACSVLNDHLVTVSEDLKDRLIHTVPSAQKKVTVIPNGVVRSLHACEPVVDGQRRCISISSLIPRKQMQTVIRAFALAAAVNPGWRLQIVGDGPERKALEDLAGRLGVVQRVDFTGMLDPDQIPYHLSRNAVFVLASASEGRPNVILEAMAAGIPVVASDITGVREMIGTDERGLLFPVGDAAQCALCMERVLGDPTLATTLVANARQWLFDQGLTWENSARRYFDLFKKIIHQNRQACSGTGFFKA